MPPSYAEVKQSLKRVQPVAQNINMALLETAAVKAQELTGHPGWDLYLQQCQALRNTAEAELKAWTENCLNAVKTDDMRYAQRNVERFKAQIEVLDKVMGLPGQILKEAQK